jgi:Spy/CpxP family protein refolding chaperone
MKTTKFSAMVAITLAGLVTLAPMARAQDNKSPDSKPKTDAPQRPRGGNQKERLNKMAEDLGLNADQKDKFQAAMKEQADKRSELQKDTALSQEDRRTKMGEIRKNTTAKVKEILTPEQFEKWQKLNQAGGQRGGGQRGGGRRGNGGGADAPKPETNR